MRIFMLFLVFMFAQIVKAQKNSVYFEAFGNAGLASLNYERQMTTSPIFLLRIGVGITRDNLVKPTRLLSIPSSIHYLIDLKKNNYLDLNIGVSWYDAADEGAPGGVYHLFTGVGFRRNFARNWFFRVHVSPYIRSLTKSIELESSYSGAGYYSGFSSFFFSSSSPKFYRYAHEDAWVGFSIGIRF